MNPLTVVISLFFALNVYFVQGLGLEILGVKNQVTWTDVLRISVWNLVTSVLLVLVGWFIPEPLAFLRTLVLSSLALVFWVALRLFGAESSAFYVILVQSAGLGMALGLLGMPSLEEALLGVLVANTGGFLALMIVREVARFLPVELGGGLRLSLFLLSFFLASLGMQLFGFGAG